MIERPETAVPSIAVSQFVFKKQHYAKNADVTLISNRLILEIPFGLLYLTAVVGTLSLVAPLTVCPFKVILLNKHNVNI